MGWFYDYIIFLIALSVFLYACKFIAWLWSKIPNEPKTKRSIEQ